MDEVTDRMFATLMLVYMILFLLCSFGIMGFSWFRVERTRNVGKSE